MPECSEIFEIYDENGRKVGTASRNECHGNPELIHRTAHVVVYHPDGRILLQKRSCAKDIQPGKWDTAVGGHLMPGEDYETAARREMVEELGVPQNLKLTVLFDDRIRNEVESEDVRVFATVFSGPFDFQREEIDQVRFWTREELAGKLDCEEFTPNLSEELKKVLPLALPYDAEKTN